MLLQIFIILTGNYNFFNLLTIALCISLLDDDFFQKRKSKYLKKKKKLFLQDYLHLILPILRDKRKVSKFLRRSLMIFIIKGFRTIVFIFIVISTMFWPIYPLAVFRCLSNSGTFTELWTTSFIESTGVACSDSIFLYCYSPAVRIEFTTSRWLSP